MIYHRLQPRIVLPLLARRYVTTTTRVVVALSGGVDSSVAAALLLRQAQEMQESSVNRQIVSAIHMSNWNKHDDDSSSNSSCSSDADWHDAQQAARHLDNMPIRRANFEAEYWCHVFEPYISDISIGKMGNPDIACNTHVKFGCLLQHILRLQAHNSVEAATATTTKLATGHYARLWNNGNDDGGNVLVPPCVEEAVTSATLSDLDWLRRCNSTPRLLAAADPSKDQSYFLAGCQPDAFRHVLFPLGDYLKNPSGSGTRTELSVRELAREFGLPTAKKKDSMGICFVGKRPLGFRSFVSDYIPEPTRKLQFQNVDTMEIVQRMDAPEAAVLYVTGQGAKIGGVQQKYFVVDNHFEKEHAVGKNAGQKEEYHTVSVCAGTHHPALYSDSLVLESTHWLLDQPPLPLQQQHKTKLQRMRCQCRVRHLQPLVDCEIVIQNDRVTNTTITTVHFDSPMRGITAGQMVVFYVLDGLVCLGGGPIAKRGATYFEEGRKMTKPLHPAGHNDLSSMTKLAS